MEVGNQLRREIKPASEVIGPFQHDLGKLLSSSS
jgi:hypothetical protein